ncbi:MAG TPA: aminotransferase class I/II-fold pyridoxal phosphate-dependent enzyme [Solirubrobacteraceae bacterium]|nr:aminotransferase class I/II-fold pyridoxal phosphate-dependent enzyme [Solirubrobacteraceae bacterium]
MPEPEEWLGLLSEVYAERRFSNFGPLATRLERELGERYASPGRSVVLVSSATAGLTAALLALDVRGPVAMPSFTFPATAGAVVLAGCEPLFLDVSPDTWELDLGQLRDALERRKVGAIVHVRTLGLCHDLDQLERLAQAFGVPLICDAAASLGGREECGRWVGSAGDAEVFSLHATKVFGVGEGGAVFLADHLAERLRRTINFGLADGVPEALGFNGKLSEVHAAIGLAVLGRIDAAVAHRAGVAGRYRTELSAALDVVHPPDGGLPPWQTYPIALSGDAESAVGRLLEAGVGVRRYYTPPLHRTRPFAADVALPVTDDLAARMLCLPVYSDMQAHEQEEIIVRLNATLAQSLNEVA